MRKFANERLTDAVYVAIIGAKMTNTTTIDSGARLRAFLAVHRITITDLAAGVGKSRTFITEVAQGKEKPSGTLSEAIIAYLGRSTGLTVTREDIWSE